jgi:purine-binding chemotaxis protein CheW
VTNALDWASARARLERAQAALTAERTPAQEQQLLEARARVLARPAASAEGDGEVLDVVVFVLGGGRFAVEARHVLAATPLGVPTPLPGVRDIVIGVVNHRGRVVPVLDLRRRLTPGDTPGELTHAVAVSVDGMTFAIAAEAVEETTRTPCAVGGVTDDLLTVLDLEALAADPRLRIDDD